MRSALSAHVICDELPPPLRTGLSTSMSGAKKNDAAPAESEGAGATATDAPDTAASVMAYLRSRGFAKALAALQAEMGAAGGGSTPEEAAEVRQKLLGSSTVSVPELASKNAPRDPRDKDAPDAGSSSALENAGAQALLLDPTDTARGFAMIKTWCCGSLDIYQPELLPLLLPLFVHSYLNLVDMGLGAAAAEFYQYHAPFFMPMHATLLSHIRSLALPSQIGADELAQRFRTERYVIKMSSNVFGLLIGWLTDGTSPVGFAGLDDGSLIENMFEPSRRGREAMLKIVNERCRIQGAYRAPAFYADHAVLRSAMLHLDPVELEEGTGLTGAGPSYSGASYLSTTAQQRGPLQPQAVSESDAVAEFNQRAAGPQLKLHPRIPLADDLRDEVQLVLHEEQQRHAGADGSADRKAPSADAEQGDVSMENAESDAARRSVKRSESVGARESSVATEDGGEADPSTGLLEPTLADLPPQPTTFRTVDLLREVERVRDARKCLRIDPKLAPEPATADAASARQSTKWQGVPRTVGLPSVCMYTYFDAEDGLTCSRVSEDLTLMAAGFEESYVQLWSLKGEPLRELRSDFSLSSIKDRRTLQNHRKDEQQSARKLVGHSAPVYGVAFDPVGGSASRPRHMLSCSADGTARLWSLDTYSALVSYRGHQYPVWDVTWGPLGAYFATASADRTARLWSTERINPLRIYAGHLSDVDCLRFHPNSLYLATGSSDRSCRLWDVQRGACVRLFVGHQSPISCVRISSDGRYLASAGAGNSASGSLKRSDNSPDEYAISLWDLASGRRIKKMWGHTAAVHEMDFSADGAMLVSGGADATVRCWDVRAAQSEAGAGEDGAAAVAAAAAPPRVRNERTSADCVATYYTKDTPVYDIHFSPRNLCLAAGVYDG